MHHFENGNFQGKTVFVRADLNVPMKDGQVRDDYRLQMVLPTLEKIISSGGRVVLASHLGRPEGKWVRGLTLAPIARKLQEALPHVPVHFVSDLVGEARRQALDQLNPGEILMIENLRFLPEEEANDPAFAKALAEGCDLYVNDAFACSHRAHASIDAIARYLPSYPGHHLQEEVGSLERLLKEPKRPFVALVGGSKLSTKLDLLEQLLPQVNTLLVGGAMANTFLKVQGYEIGKSLNEPSFEEAALRLLAAWRQKIILPRDVVVVEGLRPGSPHEVRRVDQVELNQMIVDLGPETVRQFEASLGVAATCVWNGSLGVSEIPPFDESTKAIGTFLGHRTQNDGLVSVSGGGDTVADLKRAGVLNQLTYVSTAGGAFLEWLEGRTLPGLEILKKES